MMFKNCCCSVGGTQQDVKMEVGENQLMSLQPPAFWLLTPQATSPLPSLTDTLGSFRLLFLTFSRVFYKKKIAKSNRIFDKSYILDESIETSIIYKNIKSLFTYMMLLEDVSLLRWSGVCHIPNLGGTQAQIPILPHHCFPL